MGGSEFLSSRSSRRCLRVPDGGVLVQEVWGTENGEEFSDMARGTLAHCLRYVTESVCNAVY